MSMKAIHDKFHDGSTQGCAWCASESDEKAGSDIEAGKVH